MAHDGDASGGSTSGIQFLRYAASGKNRFVAWIALLAALGGFLFGYDTGIIGQALPFIHKEFGTSTVEDSWVVASLLIGAIFGAAGAGWLADQISRKWTKCLSGCVYVVGALLCAFAQDAIWLIVARFVLGLSVGCASFVAPEYIAEQTPPKIRGGTTAYNQLMVTLGILLAYIAGFGLKGVTANWRWMLAIAAVPGAALAIAMVFVPHSPRWLVSKGRDDEARKVLRRTRDYGDDRIDQEVNEIRGVVGKERHWSLGQLFSARIRPLMTVGIALAVLQQFVGVNTIVYFTATILKFTGSNTDLALQQAIYVGVTNVVLTIAAILLMDWVGRRWLLIPGTIVLTLALAGLGCYFYFPSLTHDYIWLGLVLVVVYIAGFAIGQGPVFWVMIAEIYPLHMRSKAMAVATMFNWAANFIVSYYFLQMIDAIGKSRTFWVYAFIGVIATVYYFFKLPETKHKSLEQIETEIGGTETAKAAASGGA